MISRALGILSFFLGILWILRPQNLRGWFIRYTGWTVLWPLFFFVVFLLFKWNRTLGLGGLALAVFFTGLLMRTARHTVKSGFEKLPLVAFQVVGLLHLILGVSLFFS